MASNQQDLRQQPGSHWGGQSMSPNMNAPLRPAPELPSYDAINPTARPPRNAYGRVPGMAEAQWPLDPTPARSSPPPIAPPPPPTIYTQQPYGEVIPQPSTALQHQKARVSADFGSRGAVPQQNQGRARASSHQQVLRPAFNDLGSPPPPHFYDGRNDVLGSGPYPRLSNAQDRAPVGRVPPSYDGRSDHTQNTYSPQLYQQGYPNQVGSQAPQLGQQVFQGQPIYHREQFHQDQQSPLSPQLSQQTSPVQLSPQTQNSQMHQPIYQGQLPKYGQDITHVAQQEQPFHRSQQISYSPHRSAQSFQTQSVSPSPQIYQDQQTRQSQLGSQPVNNYQAISQIQPVSHDQRAHTRQPSYEARGQYQGLPDDHRKLTAVDEQARLAQQKNQGRHGSESRHSQEARQSYEIEKRYEAEQGYKPQRSHDEQQGNVLAQITAGQQGQQGPRYQESHESHQGGQIHEAARDYRVEAQHLSLRPHQGHKTQHVMQGPENRGRHIHEGKLTELEQQAWEGLQNGQAQQTHEKHQVLQEDQQHTRLHKQYNNHAQSQQAPTKNEARKTAEQTGAVAQSPKVAPQEKPAYPSPASHPTAAQLSTHGMPSIPTVAPKTQAAPRSTSQPPGLRSVSQPNPQAHKLHKSSQPNLLKPRNGLSPDLSPSSSPQLRGRNRSGSNPAIPDIRAISTPGDSVQPSLYHLDAGGSDGKSGKRRSWIPGSKSRQTSEDMTALMNGPPAWVIGGPNKVSYNMQPLKNAEMVPELWDDNADTFVYLFPPESRQGPCFRIPSITISSSPILRKLAFGESQASNRRRAKSFDGRNTLSVNDALHKRNSMTPPYTPTMTSQDNQTSSDGSAESLDSLVDQAKEGHLFYPFDFSTTGQTLKQVAQEEYDHLLSARNLFSYLTCRPLVATRNCPNIFSILSNIANDLKRLEFSNADGSTYGEVASTSLNFYIDSLGLADVRISREKTLEGIVLGERLRSAELYNEAFTHAVGKYEAITELKSPVWDMITSNTRNRLERAFMDLTQREHGVQLRLSDFEFPSLFAGYAASTSTAASKVVRFRNWKSSFLSLRRHVLSYYKDLYGDWPPKAKSKKNQFTISGLNRLVLKALYTDFCTIYDLLVDRESLTTRSMDIDDVSPEEEEDLAATAMRKILTEYDRSSPPVQPPIPFDLPKVPSMTTLNARHNELPLKTRQQAESRKLQGNETILLLTKSHNLDSDRRTSFLQAFQNFEEKEARGRTVQELADQRFGYWLFVYVVLQALPMVVIDAPGLKFTQGVEYFLCQPPKGGMPWVEDAMAMQKTWYGVDGGSKVVALPSDFVHHSVEAVYRRSHCWIAAEKWLDAGHGPADTEEEQHSPILATDGRVGAPFMPLVPPPFDEGRDGGHHPTIHFTGGMHQSAISASTHGEDTNIPISQVGRPRARSGAANHRKSIAFGLEQLPVPPGYSVNSQLSPHGSPHHSPLLGSEPQGTGYGLPVEDRGRRTQGHPDSAEDQGKSFDDILNAVQSEKEQKKKESGMRRKSFMGF